MAGDGAIAESTNLPALGNKIEGFVGINRYVPVLDGAAQHAARTRSSSTRRWRGSRQIDPSGPLPDRYVQSNFEAMNALKIGMEKSGFQGREDTMKLIEALEGLEMKEGDDFPQGDKTAAQGGPPGLPARVHLRDQGRQAQDPRRRPQGEDDRSRRPASSPSVTADASRRRALPGRHGRGRSAAVLRTEGLTVRFGGLTRSTTSTSRSARGEIRAIIGPNGAGKSTFFNCLTGVLRPTAGRILFNGEDITGLPPDRISQQGHRPLATRSPTSCPTPPCWRTCASPPSRAATAGAC